MFLQKLLNYEEKGREVEQWSEGGKELYSTLNSVPNWLCVLEKPLEPMDLLPSLENDESPNYYIRPILAQSVYGTSRQFKNKRTVIKCIKK